MFGTIPPEIAEQLMNPSLNPILLYGSIGAGISAGLGLVLAVWWQTRKVR